MYPFGLCLLYHNAFSVGESGIPFLRRSTKSGYDTVVTSEYRIGATKLGNPHWK